MRKMLWQAHLYYLFGGTLIRYLFLNGIFFRALNKLDPFSIIRSMPFMLGMGSADEE